MIRSWRIVSLERESRPRAQHAMIEKLNCHACRNVGDIELMVQEILLTCSRIRVRAHSLVSVFGGHHLGVGFGRILRLPPRLLIERLRGQRQRFRAGDQRPELVQMRTESQYPSRLWDRHSVLHYEFARTLLRDDLNPDCDP